MSATLAAAPGKGKRRALDFYPTPPEGTAALMEFLSLSPRRILEPACGDGAMVKVLEAYGHDVHAADIRETGFGRGGVDFLRSDCRGFDAIITNPPFSQSGEFIVHALASGAPIVAMLLKSQYWHAEKRRQLFEAHRPAFVLPLAFRLDFMNGESGGAPTMECLWTIWAKGQTDAGYRVLPRPSLNRYFLGGFA